MGRFYKTATPQKLDFMSRLPEQALMQAMQATDQRLADQESAIYDLYGQLQANALSKDKTRRDEILKGYEGKVDELASKFQENPLAYANTKGQTRKLAREIHEDWTRGEVSAIQGNYNARADFVKRYKEAMAAGKVNAKDFETALAYFDSKFQGTNYDQTLGKETGTYSTEELSKFVNVETLAETRGEGYIADVITQLGAYKEGDYIYTSKDSKKEVTYDEIFKGVKSAMYNDTELIDYLNQQQKFGRYAGEENPIEKRIEAAASRVANKYSHREIEQGRTSMKADAFALKEREYELKKDFHGYKENFKTISSMPIDRNNEQWTYDPIAGGAQNVDDLNANIKGIEDNVENLQLEAKKRVYEKLNALQNREENPMSKKEAMQVFNEINQAIDNGDYQKAKQIYAQYGIGQTDSEGNIIGTGLDELQSQVEQQQAEITNQKNFVTAITKNAEEKLTSAHENKVTQATRVQSDEIAKLNNEIQLYQKELTQLTPKKTGPGQAEDDVESYNYWNNKIAEAEAKKAELQKTKDAIEKNLNDEFNKTKDESVKANVNAYLQTEDAHKYQQSIYSTSGNYYDDLGLDQQQKAMLVKYNDNVSKNIFEYVAADGHGYVVVDEYVQVAGKSEPQRVTKKISFKELIENKNLNFKEIKALNLDEEGDVVKRMEGEKEITYKKGDTRFVPHNIPELGRNSYQTSYVIDDPTTGKPTSITIYVPQKDLPANAEVQSIFNASIGKVGTEELERSATRMYSNSVQKGTVKKEDATVISSDIPGATYNAFMSQNGQVGKWTFKFSDGTTQELYGNAGRDFYRHVLETKTGSGRVDPNVLRGYKLKTSRGMSTSNTNIKSQSK